MINTDFNDAKPIYLQIEDKIKSLIIKGVLKEDERIPSVRELAVSMTINPNTIQKAYKELEAQGFIYSKRATGYFVASRKNSQSAEKIKTLTKQYKDIVSELKFLGMPSNVLTDIVEKIYNGGNNDD